MQPVRLGIVGPGLIWRNAHEPAIRQLDAFRVSALCARSDASQEWAAASYPDVPFYRDYREMVVSPGIDAVVVLTPIPMNAPVAMAALQAGKDVLLEKPMARTLDEGRSLLDAVRTSSMKLWVLEQFAYGCRARRIAEILQSGQIGNVVLSDMVNHSWFDPAKHSVRGYGSTAWRINPEFILGTLFDGGHHPLALQAQLFGEPAWVDATGASLRDAYGDYDHVLTHSYYDSGMQSVFSHASHLGGQRNYWHIRGTDGLLSVYRDRIETERNDGGKTVEPAPRNDMTLSMWQSFADCFESGTEPIYGPTCAFRELRTLHAIDLALRTGQRVSPIESTDR